MPFCLALVPLTLGIHFKSKVGFICKSTKSIEWNKMPSSTSRLNIKKLTAELKSQYLTNMVKKVLL